MRQISILLLMCFSVAAAPTNRERVNKQINDTVIPKVGNLQGFKLNEIMDLFKKFSNNKINFLYFPPKPKPQAPLIVTNNIPQFGGVDPATGLPALPPNLNQPPPFVLPVPPPLKEDIVPEIKIFTGEIKNITIKQLLEIVVMSSHPPIQYVVMDYGVVFIPQKDEAKAYMPIRTFRLNRNPFRVDR
tara:strand:+ start:6460 stop:7020 length:561 start_codon:yes stop_codon:yes gene_type:complete